MTFSSDFYKEIVQITKNSKKNVNLVNSIKAEIKKKAYSGSCHIDRIHQLEGKYNKVVNLPSSFSDCSIKQRDIDITSSDNYIINEFELLGFELTYTLVNKNPHPEVGQEGLDLRVYLNISWNNT